MDGSTSRSLSIATPSETNLTATVLDLDQRTLLLTAANTGSGTSTSTLAFASQLALMSAGSVLLIDSSNSANSLSQQLGLGKLRGFTDLLFDQDTPPLAEDCIVRLSDQAFDMLPGGTWIRGRDRLDPERLRVLLRQLAAQYRFVVIDGEAVYASADSLVIGPLVDGVILVVCGEQTRWEVAQAAAQRLSQAGARLIGSVFNKRKYYMPKWLYDNL
ncbi:CpsD/CapB family tyrosine-protein kinase [Pseudomonas guariconensis]|uniref:CpsD/CapB family tyrosine-protein kinase n=1 Tax=Pseudomonas TaxID=286 RepID=UPI00209852EC|nr:MULTISPECIES: CpsD/CapB family tyrosine-protein kinase [Pseudomonas]MCO7642693.1 CpsD/CapB family tyrosine-protein kinase [Pseudomonas sp. S 311-6]MCO7517016.1 CpsD/CapB family tyrosine-protein kinase [Pseudomonas putida]MCO7564122.1 CpsD/CapB family tyrosine-protein kinase [Pseudomonas mosselii]MCO7593992.1 CpsD/CapB family tyrosine-protein kinase [Pseudomonas guariconensis]MCO7607367.1 CpsD/CapB family tyrosine-protein kinase [Pseudomonas guariconensis]